MYIKTEIWKDFEIRFVEKEPGDWWAVLADIAKVLQLSSKGISQRLPGEVISNHPISDTLGRKQEMLIVNEYGIYEAVFESRKKEAKNFKRWVFEMLKSLRQASGLESFQVFRMLDKEHQKGMMAFFNGNLPEPKQLDFIKANTVSNKAVSTLYGYPKMINKENMSPQMLRDRQPILEDAIQLAILKNKFGINLSVSKVIYNKYCAV